MVSITKEDGVAALARGDRGVAEEAMEEEETFHAEVDEGIEEVPSKQPAIASGVTRGREEIVGEEERN